MSSLLEETVKRHGIQIDVATAQPGLADDSFDEEGVKYFVIGQPKRQSIFSCRNKQLKKCIEIVHQTDPDIVHIHGSERFFGLMAARQLVSAPCVISLQGLIGPYLAGFFGGLSLTDLWRSHRLSELATKRGLLWRYREWVAGASQEREILAGAKFFVGRTEWDCAHLRSINPAASYQHVGEVLRPIFSEQRWDVEHCERHSVIFTNAGDARRGADVLLRAMLIIRREFPDAKLRLAGDVGTRRGYDRFLRRLIAELQLTDSVEFLGYLDGDAMARELCRSHIFAIPSYIENSPNSLCEAMQVGLPCVASYAGGMPSLIEHGRTGLLFPVGDGPLLAESILRIFRDDELAIEFGWAARAIASERHAPKRVVSQLLNAYNGVIANGHATQLYQAVSQS